MTRPGEDRPKQTDGIQGEVVEIPSDAGIVGPDRHLIGNLIFSTEELYLGGERPDEWQEDLSDRIIH